MLHRGLDRPELRATAEAIARVQQADGCIPWFRGGHADPWDHIEAAMALDVGRLHSQAERAYMWLAATQRRDGAWAAAYRSSAVVDFTLDANFSSYVAVGTWHHYLATGNREFIARMWPTVERAIDFALDLQEPNGAILWARDSRYRPWPGALLTSCSCIFLSIRCALAACGALGYDRPDWELSLASLGHAIAHLPDAFEDKDRFSMDWYYPVLSGALTEDAARRRIATRWDDFVVGGRGVRCVSDRPWITTGETCELVLTLTALGLEEEARDVYQWVQHLRSGDGAYWTGATFPEGIAWPAEKPTWGSGAALLASDALSGAGPTSQLFCGEGLPEVIDISDVVPNSL